MFDKTINTAIKKSNEGIKKNTYLKDGLRYCSKCNEPKQAKKMFFGKEKIVGITCKCDEQQEEQRQKELQDNIFWELVKRNKEIGITDKAYLSNTFENDDNRNPDISSLCNKYVKAFDKMKENNYGILFYGDVGTGKSFYACCIGNELLSKGKKVLITSLGRLAKNRLDKTTLTTDLSKFDLIIIDDLGVENDSTATIYNIVDDIYRFGINLIVTTNLSPEQLKNPTDLNKKRVYDRICEMCCTCAQFVPITITRLDKAKAKVKDMQNLLNSNSYDE